MLLLLILVDEPDVALVGTTLDLGARGVERGEPVLPPYELGGYVHPVGQIVGVGVTRFLHKRCHFGFELVLDGVQMRPRQSFVP